MSEPMTVYPELWPVTADEEGLWLISGNGPWQSGLPVAGDNDIHAEVELGLQMNGIELSDVTLLHSTSWRQEGTSILLTYIAIIRRPGQVLANWPGAEPIVAHLPAAVGRPLPHGAAEPPTPRYVDCLLHALRHVAFLRDTDSSAAAALDRHWLRQLDALTPALAGMYNTEEHRIADHRRAA